MSTELKQCAHCGSYGIAMTDGRHSKWVQCMSSVCRACTKVCETDEEAATIWNRRTDPVRDQLVSALEEASAILAELTNPTDFSKNATITIWARCVEVEHKARAALQSVKHEE